MYITFTNLSGVIVTLPQNNLALSNNSGTYTINGNAVSQEVYEKILAGLLVVTV